MEHLIKTVNLVDEKDLSLQRMDDRIEFIAAASVDALASCVLYVCITNT